MDSTPSVKTTPSGLDHSNVIDVIAYDDKTGEVTLTMRDFRKWDGSESLLFLLQEKINAYLSFALDGEMNEAYPSFAGKAIRVQLDTAMAPDPRTLEFIGIVREQIAYQGIKFEITIHGQTICACGSTTPCES